MRKSNKVRSKLSLSEINELVMCMFIVKRETEKQVVSKIESVGGIVVSVSHGKGVSRYSIFEAFGVGSSDISLVISQARKEDAEDVIREVSNEFKFYVPGNGKGFALSIDGYMGAKAPFMD